MASVRLDKLISAGLIRSRADAKRLLSSGAVTVNGTVVRQGSAKADPELDTVCVDGKRLDWCEHLYIVMNKPLGVVCSTDDPDSKTVLELLPPAFSRRGLFPAGRLDKYSEGMLLITDDGDFAHRMLAPKKHLPKIYEVMVDRPVVCAELAEVFAQGISLGNGQRSSPAVLEPLGPAEARVTIFEGMYHQIRRMFEKNGASVTRLKRIQIGGLALDGALAPGESRMLTEEELAQLFTSQNR